MGKKSISLATKIMRRKKEGENNLVWKSAGKMSAIHRMACVILTKEALTHACLVNFVLHIFSFILFICKIIKAIYIYFGVLI